MSDKHVARTQTHHAHAYAPRTSMARARARARAHTHTHTYHARGAQTRDEETRDRETERRETTARRCRTAHSTAHSTRRCPLLPLLPPSNSDSDNGPNHEPKTHGTGIGATGNGQLSHVAQRTTRNAARIHASTHPRIHARARKHARDTCTHTHATSRVHLTAHTCHASAAAVLIKPIEKTFRCCFGEHLWMVAAAATCQPPTGL